MIFTSTVSAQDTLQPRTDAKIFYLRLEADRAYQREEYHKAILYWDSIIGLDGEKVDYYYNRSRVYTALQDYGLALKDCNRMIALDSTAYEGYWHRAEVYFAQEQINYSIGDLNRALLYIGDHKKDKYEILFDRGFCKKYKKDYAGAEKDFRRILEEFDQNHLKTLKHLGIVLNYAGRYEESVRYLSKAMILAPEQAHLYVSLGFTYLSMQDYETARNIFDQGLELAPQKSTTQALCYSNRSYCLLQLGSIKAAMKDANFAIQLLPNNAYAYRNRAHIYLHKKKIDKACVDIDTALSLGLRENYKEELEHLQLKHCQ
ncbi:MAG: tetratricopeptide repeat protein [Saprospiraceae bacterium]|nr:tetratricopeptide repeat protein [Saprospiraceae bacterium]